MGGGGLLVIAIAGYARGAGAAYDYVGGEGWACAVGAVEGGGGAGEFVGAGVAAGVGLVFLGVLREGEGSTRSLARL